MENSVVGVHCMQFFLSFLVLYACDNHSVIADRKTAGRAEGKVTVNGYDKKADTFARVMGYCEQFDVHSPGLTVAESVRFSADLRLESSVSDDDVRFSCSQV